MRVVVLGGTRFVGRALVAELIAAGHVVVLVHRGVTEPDDLPAAQHVHLDRAETSQVADELSSFGPDAVVDTWSGTAAEADAALAAVAGLGDVRLVVLSSMDVYAAYGALHAGTDVHAVPLDETSPVREERFPYRGRFPGHDDYEKLDVEERYLAKGGTVLRLPMVYGPHDDSRREEFVLRRVRAGRTRMPFGPGTFLWTKGFVDDMARGIRLAVERDEAAGEVLNLGERRTWTMRHWAEVIASAAGAELELVRVPGRVLPPDLGITAIQSQHLLVDSSKARDLLGWSDGDPVEAVGASVAWHLANPPEDTDEDLSADDAALASAS